MGKEWTFYAGSAEPFIGVTNMLDGAQVWKTKKQARQAIYLYTDFFLEQLREKNEVRVHLKCLKHSPDDELIEELVESLAVVSDGQDIDIITLSKHN